MHRFRYGSGCSTGAVVVLMLTDGVPALSTYAFHASHSGGGNDGARAAPQSLPRLRLLSSDRENRRGGARPRDSRGCTGTVTPVLRIRVAVSRLGEGFDFYLCGPHSRPPSERESSNSRAKSRISTGSRGESEPARPARGVRSAIALGGDARWRAPDVGYRHLAFACHTPRLALHSHRRSWPAALVQLDDE